MLPPRCDDARIKLFTRRCKSRQKRKVRVQGVVVGHRVFDADRRLHLSEMVPQRKAGQYKSSVGPDRLRCSVFVAPV